MQKAVESFAVGYALTALRLLDERSRLRLGEGPLATTESLLDEWAADKTPLPHKAMIAATRAEQGDILDADGIEAEIELRDGSKKTKRFAPGDRIVLTKNSQPLSFASGSTRTLLSIRLQAGGPVLAIELDDANERGGTFSHVPAFFRHFDLGYCLTCHKSQGRTLNSAHVLVNLSMADRKWAYSIEPYELHLMRRVGSEYFHFSGTACLLS